MNPPVGDNTTPLYAVNTYPLILSQMAGFGKELISKSCKICLEMTLHSLSGNLPITALRIFRVKDSNGSHKFFALDSGIDPIA
jgi:hypothetical protein